MPIIGDDLEFRVALYDASGNLTTAVFSSQVVYDPSFAVIGVVPAFVVNAAGVYTYTLPGANVLSDGMYVAIVKTVDPLVSNPTTIVGIEVGGTSINAADVWDYLTTLIVTPGSIGAYILQQLGLISAGVGVIINAPLSPSTLELTLYNDTDYNTLSGVVLPTWTNADWIVYGLQTATSITLYWAITSSSEDTAAGTIVVDSATSFHLEIDHTEVFTLPLGVNVAGYKVIAVLDNAHFNEEVMLVNAALTHLNYVLYAADDLNTEPPP
jgi:hypothetical protein